MFDANSHSTRGEQEDIAKVLWGDRSRMPRGLSRRRWGATPYVVRPCLLCVRERSLRRTL